MGSCLPSFDPWISEWGNPTSVNAMSPLPEYIGQEEGTRGIETSQYPLGKENNSDSPSSGERKGKSLNRTGVISLAALPVRGSGSDHLGSPEPRRSYKVGWLVKAVWKAAPQRVIAP